MSLTDPYLHMDFRSFARLRIDVDNAVVRFYGGTDILKAHALMGRGRVKAAAVVLHSERDTVGFLHDLYYYLVGSRMF